jgi:hypothetical protein
MKEFIFYVRVLLTPIYNSGKGGSSPVARRKGKKAASTPAKGQWAAGTGFGYWGDAQYQLGNAKVAAAQARQVGVPERQADTDSTPQMRRCGLIPLTNTFAGGRGRGLPRPPHALAAGAAPRPDNAHPPRDAGKEGWRADIALSVQWRLTHPRSTTTHTTQIHMYSTCWRALSARAPRPCRRRCCACCASCCSTTR